MADQHSTVERNDASAAGATAGGDIDDVLTSVLRLVSDDLRVPGRIAPAAAGRDRLLLTPAQRIGVPAPVQTAAAATAPDDAALREMIREILREELQGALGERITRNVRKLVLAEVRRTLSMQDLD